MAHITLKACGYNIDSQARNYITDQKLTHYCKISLRAFFRSQVITMFVIILVSLLVTNWQMDHIPDLSERTRAVETRRPGSTLRTFRAATWVFAKVIFHSPLQPSTASAMPAQYPKNLG